MHLRVLGGAGGIDDDRSLFSFDLYKSLLNAMHPWSPDQYRYIEDVITQNTYTRQTIHTRYPLNNVLMQSYPWYCIYEQIYII